MSKKLLTFLLSELTTVRVICRHAGCGAITEVPIDALQTMLGNECPVCRTRFLAQAPPHVQQATFADLAKAINGIAANKDRVEIEFVLPDES